MKKNVYLLFCLILCLSAQLSANDVSNTNIKSKIIISAGLLDSYIFDSDLSESMKIVDIRPSAEFEAGHIKNAVNVPFNDNYLKSISEQSNPGTFILYSSNPKQAEEAAKQLREDMGNEIYALGCSYKEWIEYQISTQKPVSPEALLRKIDEEHYQLNNISIDLLKEEVSFEAEFILQKGPIEVILTGYNGKEHESVLVSDIIPSQLQVSLLLMGAECGLEMNNGVAPDELMGDSLQIFVEWAEEDGAKNRKRISELAYDYSTKSAMALDYWIFRGSELRNGKFLGDTEKAIIATYNFKSAIIDNPLVTGINDSSYLVNEQVVPVKGTRARIIIKKK